MKFPRAQTLQLILSALALAPSAWASSLSDNPCVAALQSAGAVTMQVVVLPRSQGENSHRAVQLFKAKTDLGHGAWVRGLVANPLTGEMTPQGEPLQVLKGTHLGVSPDGRLIELLSALDLGLDWLDTQAGKTPEIQLGMMSHGVGSPDRRLTQFVAGVTPVWFVSDSPDAKERTLRIGADARLVRLTAPSGRFHRHVRSAAVMVDETVVALFTQDLSVSDAAGAYWLEFYRRDPYSEAWSQLSEQILPKLPIVSGVRVSEIRPDSQGWSVLGLVSAVREFFPPRLLRWPVEDPTQVSGWTPAFPAASEFSIESFQSVRASAQVVLLTRERSPWAFEANWRVEILNEKDLTSAKTILLPQPLDSRASRWTLTGVDPSGRYAALYLSSNELPRSATPPAVALGQFKQERASRGETDALGRGALPPLSLVWRFGVLDLTAGEWAIPMRELNLDHSPDRHVGWSTAEGKTTGVWIRKSDHPDPAQAMEWLKL